MSVHPDPTASAADAFERRWKQRFEGYARTHEDDAGIAGWSETGLAARMRHFARHWRPTSPGDLWIDAGCGAGTYTRFMAGCDMRVLGLDYSQPTLLKAARRGGAEGWVTADVTKLPIKPGVAQGIVCFGVMQALGSSERAIEQMALAVGPQGEIWVDALNRWCIAHLVSETKRRVRGYPPHLRYESTAAIRRVVRDQGFHEVDVLWLPIVPARVAWLQPVFESAPVRLLLRTVPIIGALLSHSFVVRGRRSS